MNTAQRTSAILDALRNISDADFEQACIKAGYFPRRKHPTQQQINIEVDLGAARLQNVFEKASEGELKEELRAAILHVRRAAELMDMLNIRVG